MNQVEQTAPKMSVAERLGDKQTPELLGLLTRVGERYRRLTPEQRLGKKPVVLTTLSLDIEDALGAKNAALEAREIISKYF